MTKCLYSAFNTNQLRMYICVNIEYAAVIATYTKYNVFVGTLCLNSFNQLFPNKFLLVYINEKQIRVI